MHLVYSLMSLFQVLQASLQWICDGQIGIDVVTSTFAFKTDLHLFDACDQLLRLFCKRVLLTICTLEIASEYMLTKMDVLGHQLKLIM
jgi:hypothetical protein